MFLFLFFNASPIASKRVSQDFYTLLPISQDGLMGPKYLSDASIGHIRRGVRTNSKGIVEGSVEKPRGRLGKTSAMKPPY